MRPEKLKDLQKLKGKFIERFAVVPLELRPKSTLT